MAGAEECVDVAAGGGVERVVDGCVAGTPGGVVPVGADGDPAEDTDVEADGDDGDEDDEWLDDAPGCGPVGEGEAEVGTKPATGAVATVWFEEPPSDGTNISPTPTASIPTPLSAA